MPTITAKNISKLYIGTDGETTNAIQDISLTINEGEFVALVGPSGCGKSTFLEIVAGLLAHDGGDIYLDDQKVEGTSRDIGVVFQDASLFPWRTIKRNISYGMEIAKLPKDEQEKRLSQYIKLMNLEGFENKYPMQLSGGMKQRAGIARTLVMNPKVILMDEPFSAVDHLTRCTLQDELIKIRQEESRTILFVTHDINEAVYLADRVVLLTPRPSVIQKEYVINAPFPRTRDDDYLTRKAAEIMADIGRGRNADNDVEYMI